MDDSIKEFKAADGDVLKIYYDSGGHDGPRDWCNLAQMIFAGGQRHLGDKHDIDFPQYDSRADFIDEGRRFVKKQLKDAVYIKPVHYYNHSGCGISTSYSYPYDCPWDSGTIGFVVVTKEDIRKNWNIKRVTDKYIDMAIKQAEAEVETLNQYISGEVYGFVHEDKDEEHVDSCWGFYGDDFAENGMLEYVDEKFHQLVEDD